MTHDDAGIQRDISELLASQPPEGLPEDVRDAVSAALRREQARRASRTSRHRRWMLPAVAAAAVAVLAGTVLLPQLGSQQPVPMAAAQCRVTVQPDSDLTPVVHATGTQYTQAAFDTETRRLLAETRPCPADAPGAAEAVEAPRDASPARNAALPDLSQCLWSIIPGEPVVAVDRARYNGEEVLVAVVASSPNLALVVDCSPPPATVMYRTDLP